MPFQIDEPTIPHNTLVVSTHPEVGCHHFVTGPMITPRRLKAAKKETPPMVHDLVLALVFLAMIIAPALLAMRSEKEEEDIL
jgi:hypothetical protein